ncbi:unnamed protein product, partial [Symbiodinium microadriaticum]
WSCPGRLRKRRYGRSVPRMATGSLLRIRPRRFCEQRSWQDYLTLRLKVAAGSTRLISSVCANAIWPRGPAEKSGFDRQR